MLWFVLFCSNKFMMIFCVVICFVCKSNPCIFNLHALYLLVRPVRHIILRFTSCFKYISRTLSRFKYAFTMLMFIYIHLILRGMRCLVGITWNFRNIQELLNLHNITRLFVFFLSNHLNQYSMWEVLYIC